MSKLNELSVLEAIEGLKGGEFTSVELTQACLAQIKEFDGKIKAFITVVEDAAIKAAKEADVEIKKDEEQAFNKRPLLGIPYACKDNFNTEGIETTAASNILKGYIPPYESTVTQKLKDAGAILLGKTNLDAFAHGSSTETSDFFKTKNPWDLERVPGGSSGGSAAAVAADMCSFSIGSETAGSTRGPAAWCGVTGFKPTYGRVSRYGVIAMASSTDSPGPLTKNVGDAAYILEILAGKDPFDATTSLAATENYLENIKGFSLRGLKIGKPKSYFELDLKDNIREVINSAIELFEQQGAEIIDIDLLDPKYSIAAYTILQRSEVSSNLARFTGVRFGHERTKFGLEAQRRMMLGAYALSSGYYDQYYAKAQKVRTLLKEDLEKAFEKVDLIVGPTMPGIALKLGESDKFSYFGELMDVLAEQSSISGSTAISIPCGLSKKMPVGLQLIGPMFSETTVLGAAHKFQGVTSFHREKPDL